MLVIVAIDYSLFQRFSNYISLRHTNKYWIWP